MKFLSASLGAILTLSTALANAQSVEAPTVGGEPQDQAAAQAAQPSSPAPAEAPPAPPAQLPAPPQQPVQNAAPQWSEPAPEAAQPVPTAAAQGQWVYTQQYGWVWMPYGSQYTYAPTQAGVYPSEYVYSPSYGWSWVTAPWVFGWGVAPYFGVYGASHFGWYNHYWAGGGWHGYRPVYGGYGRPVYGGYGRPVYGGYGYRGASPYYGYHPGYAAPRGGFAAPVRAYVLDVGCLRPRLPQDVGSPSAGPN